jgi:hypothetical protein
MSKELSIQEILAELRTHAEGRDDDALLELAIAMEAKLATNGQSINVGDISDSKAIAIGNGIDIVINQSNLPEELLTKIDALLEVLDIPAAKKEKILPDWPQGKSPFPGLQAFEPEDAPIFFGRDDETAQLAVRLSNPDCRFLMVVGASGSGKSSLVKAGLIPRLRGGKLPGSENWPIVTFTPDAFGTGDPFDVLAWSLSQSPLSLDIHKTGARLREKRSGLREVLEEHLEKSSDEVRALLVIDQFEELFSRVTDKSLRKKFLALLNEAANSPRVLTVITIRDDFYHYCVKSPLLSRLINRNMDSTFTLSAPGPLELYETITVPAQVAGLAYEDDLAKRILKDTGSKPGALALLAYALDQLYKASDGDKKLTRRAYQSFGGVQGAIGARAQETFESFSNKAQETLPQVFRELLEVDENGTATRKRAPLSQVENDDACRELVQGLVDARLLVTSRSASDQVLVEVAHEALFRSWPELKAWIEEVQDDLILLRQVRTAATLWNKNNQKKEFLWPDERLRPVYRMQARLTPGLSEIEEEFIRSEFGRLLEELDNLYTSHSRRWAIGERFDALGDRRPGVGLINHILPLHPPEGNTLASADELQQREGRLWGDKAEHIGLPDLVWLPVGGGKIKIEGQNFWIHPFLITKYPVTCLQFQAFLDAPDGFKDKCWWNGLASGNNHKNKASKQHFKFDNNPRENVSWYDAVAFCRWLNDCLDWPSSPGGLNPHSLGDYKGLRLPSEWEWQYAATSGQQDCEYPWGQEWDGRRANTSEGGLSRTTAVGMYPAGAAKNGVLDMSGNVREWCLNEYSDLEKFGLSRSNKRVLRGGSWGGNRDYARASYRYTLDPNSRGDRYGFRVVVRPSSL